MTDNQKLYKALSKIAYGLIVIHVNINIGSIDILPDFAGYIMITLAIISLKDECKTIGLLKSLGIFLSVWSVAAIILALTEAAVFPFSNYINSIVKIIGIYFYFQLFTDISLIAKKYQPEDVSFDKKFITRRNIITVSETLFFFLGNVLLNSDFLTDKFNINDTVSAYLLTPIAILDFFVILLIITALFSFRKLFKNPEESQEISENINATELTEENQ